MQASDTLCIIDGSGLFYRSYHALPKLTRKNDAFPVGAIAGFCNMLWRLASGQTDIEPITHIVVAFDHPSKTFRHELYKAYKANRPPLPEDLRLQIPYIKKAVCAFGIGAVEVPGYEADDIIATLAHRARKERMQTVIVSSDKDMMQLVDEDIRMYDMAKMRWIDAQAVQEKFGVRPDQVIDMQALVGDSSDNIPGVPKIGMKTAQRLITDYENLESLLQNVGLLKAGKIAENLRLYEADARLSKKLARLSLDVPFKDDLQVFAKKTQPAATLRPFLEEMEFNSLKKRAFSGLEEQAGDAGKATGEISLREGVLVEDAASMQALFEQARFEGRVAVFPLFDDKSMSAPVLLGLGLSCAQSAPLYLCFEERREQAAAMEYLDALAQAKEVREILMNLLCHPGIAKIIYHSGKLCHALAGHGFEIEPIEDIAALSYAAHGGTGVRHDLETLIAEEFSLKLSDYASLVQKDGKKIPVRHADQHAMLQFATERSQAMGMIYTILQRRLLEEKKVTVYHHIDRPLIQRIYNIEKAGIKIDKPRMRKLSAEFSVIMAKCEEKAKAIAGRDFNIGSPKQIAQILFDVMGIIGKKKTPSGDRSTRAEVLEELATDGHEIAQIILDWRQAAKLKSTYTDSLIHVCNEKERVETRFSLHATSTGRLSSHDPNLQNIPIRTAMGQAIRTAFISERQNCLICADYSQLELRILAHLADIDSMKTAFREGVDIHAMTAGAVLGIDPAQVKPDDRRRAKAINFGIIYGMSAYGLAKQLHSTRSEAQQFIDRYFARFAGIKTYMDATIEQARRDKRVYSLFGRVIPIADIASPSMPRRRAAERAAINAPIQSSAADITRRAMWQVYDALAKDFPQARLLLQVHDELVIEAPEKEAPDIAARVGAIMRCAGEPLVPMRVRLEVECGWGANWQEAHAA